MERQITRAKFAGTMALFVGLMAAAGPRSAAAGQDGKGAAPAPCVPNASVKSVAKDSRCFELRTYFMQGGSSVDGLHAVLRDQSSALFKKHGMDIIGFWQPVDKTDVMIYLLAHKNTAAKDASWAAMRKDPGFAKLQETLKQNNVSVKIETVFMTATDYSPMK